MSIMTLRIDHAAFLVPLYVLAAVLCLFLLARLPRPRWLLRCLIAVAAGTLVGLVACWLASDVWDVFGVALTPITRMWVVFACVGVFLAVANLWGSRWWRKAVAIVAVPVFLVAAAAGINVDFGAYRDLNDAFGITPYAPLHAAQKDDHAAVMDPALAEHWRPPAGMPAKGTIGTVQIPPTKSHFNPRKASVYLPPAALVAHPPVLPVVILFPGQPGAPEDMFTAGRTATVLDAYAAAHHGLAPIVVAPDQLGSPSHNPMCVDSPLGNSATYLTVDVPHWIRTHLRVSDNSRYWAVGGFSQGGTCAIQFGAGYPKLFQSILDISGELKPTIGADTVAKGFGGSEAAYLAATPVRLLSAHAPYPDTLALFGVGAHDAKYERFQHTVMNAAARAGMKTELIQAPDSAHDWNTVRYVIAKGLPILCARFGLG